MERTPTIRISKDEQYSKGLKQIMDSNIHNQLRVHASPSHLVKFQNHEMKFNLDDCQIKKLYDSVKSFNSF